MDQRQRSVSTTESAMLFWRYPLLKIFFFEMTGTMLLTYGVVCSDIEGCPTDFFIACSLFLAISWAGEFTGGHVNPAVTLAFKIAQNTQNVLCYVVSQFTGAFLGVLLAYAITETTVQPIRATTIQKALYYLARDTFGTALFILCILMVVTKSTTFSRKKLYATSFIPIALFICREYSGGTGFNPAVAFMAQFANWMFRHQPMNYFYVLLVGPMIGSVLGALLFTKIYKPMAVVLKTQGKFKK